MYDKVKVGNTNEMLFYERQDLDRVGYVKYNIII